MTPKTISLSVLLVLALLAGCRSTHNCSRRIAVLEADLQNTQIDLECAKADILAISKSTKPAPPPPTTMFSDAQFASFNSAMTQIVAELGTISDRLKPKEEGVVPKIGSLISWVLSNGANGAKIIESLKKAGLITSTEADGLSSLADQVKNLPPTTTVFRLDPSDREEVIKRLECICDGNKEIHKSIDGLNQTLGNSHQSPPHEDRFPLWEALTGLGTVALAIVTLKLASDARQGIKEQLDAQRLAQDKQFKEQQQAQENQFEEQRAIQNQQVVEQRLAHSIDIVLKMGERWESPAMVKTRKALCARLSGQTKEGDPSRDVLSFFETLGIVVHLAGINPQIVLSEFGWYVNGYYAAMKELIAQLRESNKDASLYNEFEWLNNELLKLEAKTPGGSADGGKTLQDQIKLFLEQECQ